MTPAAPPTAARPFRNFVLHISERLFIVAVAVGFVLSFGPFLTGDLSAGTGLALGLMHVVVALAALVFLRPLSRRS